MLFQKGTQYRGRDSLFIESEASGGLTSLRNQWTPRNKIGCARKKGKVPGKGVLGWRQKILFLPEGGENGGRRSVGSWGKGAAVRRKGNVKRAGIRSEGGLQAGLVKRAPDS